MIDFEALRADGSWRLTWVDGRLDEAVFRAVPETADGRRALVEALGADASDPERWEAALVEALLVDPVSVGLRRLELHLTDFHHSARRAASAVATYRREQLSELYFGHDFEFLYENAQTSTGGWIDPEKHLADGFVGEAGAGFWAALPALRELTVEGAALFDDIDGAVLGNLTDLRLRGAVLAGGEVLPGRAPSVVTLVLDLESDVHGVACPVELLDELDPARFPGLRHLDLGRVEFDAGDVEILAALAGSAIVPRLESLTIRQLVVADHDVEAVGRSVDAFAHLRLSAAGAGAVEPDGVLPAT
ncbi:hypothetical protein [Saccharothrix violaceirubra]|uniref:Uncharacterized protein n=1 Tax=Saccharothrix violaceirubra TaxID=413306 RepID=A0A7W7T3W6_9PSEU|nr:hypothetical protein [Saccharothrix violaceirubra]MBB4966104.1 hypothetical protein [Saccharothrix violaceirubra]